MRGGDRGENDFEGARNTKEYMFLKVNKDSTG
jgi:hypothetical protein